MPPSTGSQGVQPPFFQKVVVWGTGVCIHYCPRRVDIAALRDGDFLELLNLVPWGGVDLTLKPLRFTGVVGWDGLAAGLASEWASYVARTQAHKFLAGVAPIRSVIQVSSAVATLLSGPAAGLGKALGGAVTAAAAAGKAGAAMWQQQQGGGGGANGGFAASNGGLAATRQQLQSYLHAAAAAAAAAAASAAGGAAGQYGVGTPQYGAGRQSLGETLRGINSGFARSLLYEAMGVGASVASGAQAFLAAGPAAGQGLRAAATEVQGGFQEAAAVLAQGAGARAGGSEGRFAAAARQVLRAGAGVRTVLRGQQQGSVGAASGVSSSARAVVAGAAAGGGDSSQRVQQQEGEDGEDSEDFADALF